MVWTGENLFKRFLAEHRGHAGLTTSMSSAGVGPSVASCGCGAFFELRTSGGPASPTRWRRVAGAGAQGRDQLRRGDAGPAARAGVLPGAGALLAVPRRSYGSTANRGGDQGSSERGARWCYSRLAHRLLLHRALDVYAIATDRPC